MSRASDSYQKIRAADIPTWTTYRVCEREHLALMTFGAHDRQTFISYNDPSTVIEKRMKIKLEKLKVDEISRDIKSICTKAANNYIFLTPDAFGYIISHDEKEDIDTIKPIISDFDFVERHEGFGLSYVYNKNMESACKSLHGIFRLLEDTTRNTLVNEICLLI